jgi:hypothetical protein
LILLILGEKEERVERRDQGLGIRNQEKGTVA